MAHPFLTRLAQRPVLADGAMGTMLHALGAGLDQCLEELNLGRPDWLREIHLAYIKAGAEIVQTNTFGANRLRLTEYGLADRVREINFQGVRLAREARELSGLQVWVAGSVGPLGKRSRRDGELIGAEVAAAFREQVGVLWEAGADLLVFETFSELAELRAAVEAARATTDLPVIAEVTFGNDGVTRDGAHPADVAQALAALNVDVAGVNCSLGPARLVDFIAEMHDAMPALRLSAMPNAGLPYRAGERMVYPSTPHYFAEHVSQFAGLGVVVLGGCCGTTPAHIQAMRAALDQETAAVAPAEVRERVPLPMVRVTMPGIAESGADEAPEPTSFLRKLQEGRFVVSVEVDPPRAFSAAKMIEGARIAQARGADAVNVADSPMARVRMGALALCVLIQQQVGIETILHLTTRDRSLMGLQADLIGAHALGVRNIIALTGDPPALGDTHDSTPVYDVDSVGLVRIIDGFNRGLDRAGKSFGSRAAFTVAVASDPTRTDLVQEVDRFHKKVTGGAHLTMTQPIFDAALWRKFYALYEERHGPFPVPVLIGILPLQSHRHASFLHNEVPGITLPESALARMAQAGAEGRREGVRMAQELLLELKELPKVQGVYLMPSFGRYEVACEVLDVVAASAAPAAAGATTNAAPGAAP